MKEFWLKRKIRKYKRRLNRHRDDPVFFHELAGLFRQLSQPEEALRYYHKTIEAYYQDDSRLGADNDFILATCWIVLELDPLDALAHQALGQEYCGLGEFEEAAKLYKSFAAKLAKIGRYDGAISQYRNALVLMPEDMRTHQTCFSLLWKLRRKKEAIEELRKIADLAEKQGNLAKAVECYHKALEIMPSNPEFQQKLRRLIQTHRHGNNQLRLVVNNDV